jgi:His/Glu/Gln/Arg/opine family amino acid ABC transporter permease subunit
VQYIIEKEMLMFDTIVDRVYMSLIAQNRYMYIVNGFWNTLLMALFSCLLGIIIGLLISIIKVIPKKTFLGHVADKFADCYLTIIRGTPVVVQLMIIYFVIFSSVNIPKLIVAIIAFGINSGAYVAEIIRSGILAVDRGQMEAGRSLGLNYGSTMRYIILPQALKNILPALGNEFIALLKETSVAGFIGFADLTKGGDIIKSQTYDAFTPLLLVAAIYLIVVMFMSHALSKLERRLRRSDHR